MDRVWGFKKKQWVCTNSIKRCPGFDIICLISYMRHVAEEGSRRNCRED